MQLQLSLKVCPKQFYIEDMGCSLGLSTALISIFGFIACFVALNMLGRIEHIKVDAAVHVNVKLTHSAGYHCNNSYIVENVDVPHLTWIELFYMKWIVFLTLIYSFLVMFLARAHVVSDFHINLISSNAMMFIGAGLTTVLLVSIIMLNDRAPFVDIWCNVIIIYVMYFMALSTTVSVIYFLIYSWNYYFRMPGRGI